MVAGLGLLSVVVLFVQRLFFSVGLADRPALLIASLLIVLGTQIFALGLIGELVIFAHAGDVKEYAIRKIHSQNGLRKEDDDPVQTG